MQIVGVARFHVRPLFPVTGEKRLFYFPTARQQTGNPPKKTKRMKTMKKAARNLVAVVCAFALFLPALAGFGAKAAAAQTWHLRVEGASQTWLSEDIPYTPGQTLEEALKTALDAQSIAYTFTPSSYGDYITSIGTDVGAEDYSTWWGIFQNGESASLGMSGLTPAAGYNIVVAYIGSDTLYPQVAFSPVVPVAGQPVTLTVTAQKTDYSTYTVSAVPVEGAAVTFAGLTGTTDANGQVTFTAPAAGSYTYGISKEGLPAPALVRTGAVPFYVYAKSGAAGAADVDDIPGHTLDVAAGVAPPIALNDITAANGSISATLANEFTYTVRSGAQSAAVTLPANLTVTGGESWNGVLAAPSFPAISGYASDAAFACKTVRLAFTFGSADGDLALSGGFATVTLAGQGGQKAGYLDAEGVFHTLSTDAASGGAYCETVGSDLVIHTNHFSTFVAYSDGTKATSAVIANAAEGAAQILAGDVSDWSAFALARAGYAVPAGYLPQAAADLRDSGGSPDAVTTLAKYILTLRAAGADPTDFNGYNLVDTLYRRTDVDTSYPLNTTYVLLALDSADYTAPADTKLSKTTLAQTLLGAQNSDGGFAVGDGYTSDVDVTAMVLSALAAHTSETGVQAAVEKALTFLSGRQQADGGFVAMGASDETAESAAQVVIALSALKLNAASDARFVKNGKSALDALLTYQSTDGSFSHTAGTGANTIATQQALEALSAYTRFTGGKTGLYDLRDVTVSIHTVTPAAEDEADTGISPAASNPATGAAAPSAPAAAPVLFAGGAAICLLLARRRRG